MGSKNGGVGLVSKVESTFRLGFAKFLLVRAVNDVKICDCESDNTRIMVAHCGLLTDFHTIFLRTSPIYCCDYCLSSSCLFAFSSSSNSIFYSFSFHIPQALCRRGLMAVPFPNRLYSTVSQLKSFSSLSSSPSSLRGHHRAKPD